MKTAAAFFEMKNLVVLIFLIFCTVSIEMQGQACSSYTTWTSGMFIGPGSYCGSNYGGTTVTSGGRLYTHRGYCSSTGPGTWDFQDIGACTSCINRTVGAASASPTTCINVAMTAITHATTQVTGIASSSGLPSGVSASYSGNVITISGTPTQSGTFAYTITPTSGCGTATATGTITVTANVKANNTTNLNVASSWTCGVPTSTTLAIWNSTVTGANTTSLGADVSCLGVSISNPGGLVTINSGSTLNIFASGIDMSASTQSLTLNNAVALGASQSWTVNTSRTIISSGVISGAFGMTKAGAGALTLSGTNTFTGGVTHSAGTININSAAALGTTAGTYTVAASTTMDNTSGGAITTSNYPMTINGSFTFTGTNDLNLGAGNKTLGASPTITSSTSGKTLTLDGVISGAFGMTKAGAGALTLSGTNTFTGGVTHSAGTVNINAAAALGTTAGTYTVAASTTMDNTSGGAITTSNYPMTINGSFTFTGTNDLNLGAGNKTLGASPTITSSTSGKTLTLGGVISGSYGITKAGSGGLTLSGTNTFTGGVTHNAGTLNINAAAALGTTAGTFTIAAGTTIDNTSVGSITTSNYPMTINGSFTFTGTQSLNLGAGNKSLGATPTITVSANTLTLGGVISGAFGITKAGTGILLLTGTNTYTGTSTLNAGTLEIGAANAISNSSNFVFNGGTFSTGSGAGYNETVGTLTLNANSTIALGTGSHTLNFTASNGTTWTGNTLLRITGWQGSFNGTTGTGGKIYSGSSAELSAAKLSQIYFVKSGGGQYTATQLSNGEIVPTATLPVELVSFKGELLDDRIVVSWQTASEINNEKFILEKSFDANNWFQIAEVKGAGNSTNILNYSFVDDALILGTQYYRLTQVDFDGQKETFKTIEVFKTSNTAFELKVFPNPMKDEVKVSFFAEKQGYSRFRIYAENGQQIYEGLVGTILGENIFNFNTSHFAEGIYFFKIEKENGVKSSVKVVK